MTADSALFGLLADLPRLGPKRLRVVLAHHDPGEALGLLASGSSLHLMPMRAIGSDLDRVRAAARAIGPVPAAAAELVQRCERSGVRILALVDAAYPAVLRSDAASPPVLYARGHDAAMAGRRVGIVGTRNATATGLATARELGEELAAGGVTVVSGLARGIDAAAHEGTRRSDGCAVAVVGCGPDVPYPRRNTELWEWVATDGLLLSEYGPGTQPDSWRFPQRNRILAALSEVLVVVESRERGGSLITVREALDRGVQVMAVPGSPRSRASRGTNQLLVDGAAPIASVDDVFAMLGIDHRRHDADIIDPRPPPVGDEVAVLDVCGGGPCTLDTIVAESGLSVAAAALAAARLERSGWLLEAGGWFEVAGSRLGSR